MAQTGGAAPREPGLLAFEALTGGVFTIHTDGTGGREIAPTGNNPEWSPDGRRLLYELDDGFGGLWSARPAGTDPRLIVASDLTGTARGPCDTEFGASEGAWSPSGRRVAFVGVSEDARERTVHQICSAAPDGSGVRMFGHGTEPDWTHDGRIAYIAAARSPRSVSSRIATMRRDGSGVRMLVGDAKGYRSDLDVSPDGHRLAFRESSSRTGFQPSTLRILHLRTGRTTMVPPSTTGSIGALAWTPGGTRIVYFVTVRVPGRTPPSSVYSIRPDGTRRKLLFTLPYEEHRGLWGEALSWQPAR